MKKHLLFVAGAVSSTVSVYEVFDDYDYQSKHGKSFLSLEITCTSGDWGNVVTYIYHIKLVQPLCGRHDLSR